MNANHEFTFENHQRDNEPSEPLEQGVYSSRQYSEDDIARALSFITKEVRPFVQDFRKGLRASNGFKRPYQYPVENMTADQWLPFAMCMNQPRQRKSAIANHHEVTQLKMIIKSEGGSGKSWLIHHIVEDTKHICQDNETRV